MAQPSSVVTREIKPGIGYLKIAFFPGVNGQRFARELDRALADIPDCKRLIVDLRGNLGGLSARRRTRHRCASIC
jgi:carboxyl-terminal processing protease